MLITIDIKNESKKDTFLNFIKTLDYIDIKSKESSELNRKHNNKNTLKDFFGMWKEKDIDITSIREKAWKR